MYTSWAWLKNGGKSFEHSFNQWSIDPGTCLLENLCCSLMYVEMLHTRTFYGYVIHDLHGSEARKQSPPRKHECRGPFWGSLVFNVVLGIYAWNWNV